MIVENHLRVEKLDAWGGPDRASEDFTPVQQAMGYTMSSVLTTGGIRGSKKGIGWFQPRSFNMGISREVFEKTGGFNFTHLAEDIELSIRIKKAGFKVELIADAFVYHKRRADLMSFYHQVYNFGRGRVMVGRVFPEEVKLTHWFPTLFVVGAFVMVLLIPFYPHLSTLIAFGYVVYLALILFHSFYNNKNLHVALLSVPSALLQLWGYGSGFLKEWFKSYIRSK
jgi:cellulose synthase/poly-beta-1,6-N-acetylglucosamine synthase-like glycosyltransferase